MTKERFLAFTDAIVAIIATIMVLDLPRPQNGSLSALMKLGLPFFAYFLSFFMIWSVWYNHHALFRGVKRINAHIYWLTGLWIFSMSLFPWALVRENPHLQGVQHLYERGIVVMTGILIVLGYVLLIMLFLAIMMIVVQWRSKSVGEWI